MKRIHHLERSYRNHMLNWSLRNKYKLSQRNLDECRQSLEPWKEANEKEVKKYIDEATLDENKVNDYKADLTKAWEELEQERNVKAKAEQALTHLKVGLEHVLSLEQSAWENVMVGLQSEVEKLHHEMSRN